jgi:tRNA-splicing ligase RtcB (3'-phosphate/5'-hydroxy nucleic acid ligase)
MKKLIQDEGAKPIRIWTDDIGESTVQQLRNIAQLPFLHPHGVAAMPDVHYGIGASVGSVIATTTAIIPAAVGVDIGCGMNALRTTLKAADLPDDLGQLRRSIERGVPLGAGGAHKREADHPGLRNRLEKIVRKHSRIANKNTWRQIGTLGSGNHFIEICLDEDQDVWVMLHSGSRGTGNLIGRHFIERARKEMERQFIKLPDASLAYLPEGSKDFEDYVEAVLWAQDYAMENRTAMMAEVVRNMRRHVSKPFEITEEAINCHHNYVEREQHFDRNIWVTRKGAIRAREGELGIIPGSMGQRSYIVRGKGNPDSYCSCSHGAGRRMGRNEARKRFTVADLEVQTQGVECRKDSAVLDEIPGAYKSIDEVMANQTDLVEVVHTLKQVLCVKGA